jgi:hypothetical protein
VVSVDSIHVNVTAPLHRTAQCAPHQHTLRTPHAHTARHGATQHCKGLNSRRAWHFTTMQHTGSCCSASVQNCLFGWVLLVPALVPVLLKPEPRAACEKLGRSIVRRECECARC